MVSDVVPNSLVQLLYLLFTHAQISVILLASQLEEVRFLLNESGVLLELNHSATVVVDHFVF